MLLGLGAEIQISSAIVFFRSVFLRSFFRVDIPVAEALVGNTNAKARRYTAVLDHYEATYLVKKSPLYGAWESPKGLSEQARMRIVL